MFLTHLSCYFRIFSYGGLCLWRLPVFFLFINVLMLVKYFSLGYFQNGRRKYNIRNKLDWGDTSTAGSTNSNDFLSDLLPHYVTPRHRKSNLDDEDDFHDVVMGTSKFRFSPSNRISDFSLLKR